MMYDLRVKGTNHRSLQVFVNSDNISAFAIISFSYIAVLSIIHKYVELNISDIILSIA